MTPDDPHSPGLDGDGDGDADSPVSGEPQPDPGAEDELAAVLDAYLAEVEAGNPVDPEEWIGRHPAIASRLRACLRGLHLVEAAAEALSVASAPADGVHIRRDPATALLPNGSPPIDLESHRADPEPLELGGFRVVREIGRGGMGVVYEAIEIALGRRVALKVLPFAAAIDPRQIARFRVEAQAASHLNHPHVVPVYSVGCHGGVHFYAMRLVEGPTLADLIVGLREQKGAVAEIAGPSTPASATTWSFASASGTATRDRPFFGEVARLGRQAAEALEHAHQQGVLHRDVKPSNLMVDARGQLWVADFGLARFQGEATLTAPGDLLGTLRYMSPEQAASDRALVDARSDVYSLGATLYELITLRPVFEGNNRQELLRRIAQEEPRRPRSVRPEVPRDLETIVLKAMAKEPSARYASAQELADDLGRFLDDRPILARPPGLLEKVARWARRHAAALVIAVPLLAAIAIALGVAFGLVLSKQDQLMGKQRELIAKQREVEAAHGEARRQRDEARRAVDEMYTQFAAMLGRQPDLQLIQRDFLLKALAYYQTYATETDPDPSVRTRAGVAAFRVGEIQRTLGNPADAEHAYRRAIEVLESIPRQPVDRNVLEVLARSHGSLGQLVADLGRKDEARPALERAVELTREYAEVPVASESDRSGLAAAYHRLGLWLRLMGRQAEAQEAYRKTIELASSVDGTQGREMRAGVQGNLGDLLALSGRPDEAERAFREAVTTYRSLVNGDPGVPVYRQELARALERLGTLASARPGGLTEAARLLNEALGLFDRLASDSPGVPMYRRELATTLVALAEVRAAARRQREALPSAERAVKLIDELLADAGAKGGVGAGTASPPADLRRLLLRALDRLGEALSASDRPGDLESALKRAIALREALSAENGSESTADRVAIASAGARLGAILAARGDLAGACRALRQAAERQPVASIAAANLARCAELAARDSSLEAKDRDAEVRGDIAQALGRLRRAVESGDDHDPAAPYFLSWLLIAGPLPELRDPPESARIARGLLARAPKSWVAWATLGAAQYRGGTPSEAVTALEHAADLNRGDLLHYGFFLAMAYRQLDDDDRARDTFDRTDRRLQGLSLDDEIRRLRTEAAECLGRPK